MNTRPCYLEKWGTLSFFDPVLLRSGGAGGSCRLYRIFEHNLEVAAGQQHVQCCGLLLVALVNSLQLEAACNRLSVL